MKQKSIIILSVFIALLFTFSSPAAATEKIFVNYSPFTVSSQDPNEAAMVSPEQITQQLTIIAPYTQWLRTYSCTNGLENVGRIAHSLGIYVVAGAWIGKDKTQHQVELDALIAVCQNHNADVAVIGQETLYRGDITPDELANYINYFRQSVPGFPVVIDDTFDALMNDKNYIAVKASDAVMVNIYPFWKGIDITEAVPFLHKSFFELKAKYSDKFIVVGETGWPSSGNTVGAAVPDPIYAAYYLCSVANWAKAEKAIAFNFEVFDEPWKAKYEGAQGAHWGIWDQTGKLKPYMDYTFSGYYIADYWSDGMLD